VLVAVLAGSSFLLWRTVDRKMPHVNSDLLIRVVGTRDALRGMNPYSAAVLRDIQTAYYGHTLKPHSPNDPEHFDYPALIVPLLAPFVGLSWPAIRVGFLCVVVPGFMISSFWWVRILRPAASALTLISVVALSLFAWPTVWGLRLQQPTLVIAILVAAGCYALVRGADSVAGVCMAVSLVKPQVSLPVSLWLLAWSVRHRCWRFSIGFAATLFTLWALTETMVPGWFPKWIGDMGSYMSFTAPVCEMVFGKPVGLVLTVLLGAWSILILWGMLGKESDAEEFGRALALGLAATLLIIPVEFPIIYDQVCLLPSIVVLLFVRPRSSGAVLFRALTMISVAFGFLAVILVAASAVFQPSDPVGMALLFMNQPLPIVALVALLFTVEEQGWSSTGLKKYWIRARYAIQAKSVAAP